MTRSILTALLMLVVGAGAGAGVGMVTKNATDGICTKAADCGCKGECKCSPRCLCSQPSGQCVCGTKE